MNRNTYVSAGDAQTAMNIGTMGNLVNQVNGEDRERCTCLTPEFLSTSKYLAVSVDGGGEQESKVEWLCV